MPLDLTIARADLVKALVALARATEKKPDLPMLEYALVQADADGVTATATDLKIAVRVRLATTAATADGAGTLPVARLHDLAKSLAEGPIRLSWTEGTAVRIQGGGYRGQLQSLAADDFPRVAEPPAEGLPLALPASLLLGVLKRVHHAISTKDDNRFQTTGALLETEAGTLRAVATNGHMLSMAEEATDAATAATTAIVPRRSVEAILQLFEDAELVNYAEGGSGIFFWTAERRLFSLALDGSFPSYKRVVPTGHPLRARLAAAALQDAVRRARIVAGDRVQFVFEAQTLTVKAVTADVGSGEEQLAAQDYAGDPVAVTLSPGYILDSLAAMEGEEATFELKDADAPVVLRGPGTLSVVMPMRL